uniref:Uncharacterized protein n=1 Tax=Triticum urartu TaxID=4572 RepID=A0A8R7R6S2_TRIUA
MPIPSLVCAKLSENHGQAELGKLGDEAITERSGRLWATQMGGRWNHHWWRFKDDGVDATMIFGPPGNLGSK